MSGLNLADHCLLGHANDAALADKTALVLLRPQGSEESWTYRQLSERVLRVASALGRLGLVKGDRVLLRLDNSTETAVVFFACVRAGLIPIPSSPQLRAEEVAFVLRDSGARALVTEGSLATAVTTERDNLGDVCWVIAVGEAVLVAAGVEHVRLAELEADSGPTAWPATSAEDPAYLIYTSGTTARPKGVLHAQRSVFGRATVIQEWEGLVRSDRVCHAGALNWTYTLGVGLMDPWSVGATAVLSAGGRESRFWPSIIERQGITVFAAVPTVYRQILKYTTVEEHDWSSLRHGLSAGEPLPAFVHEEWGRRVGTAIYEALGMSEISTYLSFKPGMTVVAGACGVAQRGRDIRLLALDSAVEAPRGTVGRIAVRRSDPGLMLGYWNSPEQPFEGEWFVGGDLARVDDDGVYWFEGRNDEVVKSFGYRVSPVEVEAVLGAHASVAECAVGMVKTVKTGEVGVTLLTAFVKLHQGMELDPVELDAHCRQHLAAYKVPRVYRAVDALPRTSNGKLLRRDLSAASEEPRQQ
jgi:acyl-coenzyme A synthetase/AMP-(fatty) acid ligase